MSKDRMAVVTPAFDASKTEADSFQRGLARILGLLQWAEVTVYTGFQGAAGRADGNWAVRRFGLEAELLEALRQGRHDLCLLSPLDSPLVRRAAQVDPGRSMLLADLQGSPQEPTDSWKQFLGGLGAVLFTSAGERRLAEDLFGPLPNGRLLGLPVPLPEAELERGHAGLPLCCPASDDVMKAARESGLETLAADGFLLSLREAWGRAMPVLVDQQARTAADLCLQADGGIVVQDAEGFGRALRHLQENPETARILGRQGRQFVRAGSDGEALAPAWRRSLQAAPCRRRLQGLKAALFGPVFLPHDAVSNYLAETCRLLEQLGADFSLHIQDHLKRDDFADHLRAVSEIDPQNGLEIYQYPGWYPFMERLENGRARGTTVFDFHGVTPSALWPDSSLEPSHQGLRLARKADFVFVHSRFLERELIEQHGVDPGRILRFPYSVDLSAFRPSPPDEGIQQVYGLQGKTVLLYVGRMAPNKRIDVLVEGLARLPEECLLLLVGNIGFPLYAQEAEKARKLAERLGVAERVVFAGSVSDAELRRIYSCADLMVSASLHEGFGIPFLEAMACAVPCLATDAAAIPEVIDQAGLTFRPADPAHFAEQAAKLLNDDQEYSRCSQAGLRQAQLYSRDGLHDNLMLALARLKE